MGYQDRTTCYDPFLYIQYVHLFIAGSISNIDDESEYKCQDGSVPAKSRNKVISGVVGASSSVTSIQVANLLRLFKIPQVYISYYFLFLC